MHCDSPMEPVCSLSCLSAVVLVSRSPIKHPGGNPVIRLEHGEFIIPFPCQPAIKLDGRVTTEGLPDGRSSVKGIETKLQ